MSENPETCPAKDKRQQPFVAEAVDWHVRLLSGEARQKDVDNFESWLRASPENAIAYARLTDIWNGMEALEHSDIVRESLNALRRGKSRRTRASFFKSVGLSLRRLLSPRGIAVMSGLAIAVIIAVNVVDPGDAVYRTALGEQRTVELDDGSTVMLNTTTAIKVSYANDERRISLIDGQASFDVVKDAERPFIVTAGDGVVRALGTQFDVYKSDDAVTVTLIEGRVEIASAPSGLWGVRTRTRAAASEALYHVELSPGEQAAIAPAGLISQITAIDVERVVAWREGKVNFRDTPLIDAVNEMNRYSPTKITLAEKDLETLRISGVFRVGNSKNFANALESLFDIRVERNARNNEIVLLGALENS